MLDFSVCKIYHYHFKCAIRLETNSFRNHFEDQKKRYDKAANFSRILSWQNCSAELPVCYLGVVLSELDC